MSIKLPEVLKYLRHEYDLTQKQLAKETGLSLSSIISYENGLREPNSRAMVVLERYFNVSGEYLRGEIDKDTFISKSNEINKNLDSITNFFQSYREAFILGSQEKQELSTKILSSVLEFLTNSILNDDRRTVIYGNLFIELFTVFNKLNIIGKRQLTDRADELTQIDKYVK